jgi:hypothetical protein
MNQRFSLKQLYGLAYQWIEQLERQGMTPEDAKHVAPFLLDFFEFSMEHQPKKASKT